MATVLSQSSLLSSSVTTKIPPSPPPPPPQLKINHHKPLINTLTAALAAATLLSATPSHCLAESSYHIYYGTAASAANYGGYGGNSDPKSSAEYVYDVPDGWKERLVSKVEKGTNGTDSEFYNPKKRTEKEYLTFLAGFRQLAPKDVILNNLALSDVDLQDLIAGAESLESKETKDATGQLYYVYEIDGVGKHSLIKVTCAKNKLYAHFVNAPVPDWSRDEETLRHIHDSFKTVGSF
ncbi:putative Thylakoid lumenal 19 kDa protein chloroplast precursor [Tripterygium wilfordii]|uniref:Putative Thylakoid lumenal 19 kDa protein chloroplast n=1 Tax=Tripterygium wilfordii TaxID=458696 RepID=A0A7J7CQQ0_TRIWF|nr:thylakoid lumenal 19 kDa protein, chloroplastic-like [Tripterygium wilfordii]KAF5736432.1 putative Thylakoid lumenal 19 kDa protein chloroplast precursor [Tripterygium wilfordii]